MPLSNDLEIVELQASPPQLAEADWSTGEREAWVDLAITVVNHSSDTTYYAVVTPRSLNYDAVNGRLEVGLAQPEPTDGVLSSHVVLPELETILPGETKVLHVLVPLQIKRLAFGPGSGLRVDVLDISDVKEFI